jgi:DNA gyrase subunit A
MGRGARGVRGITLSEGDYVVGVSVVDESKSMLTITDGGMGKRTPFSDFRQMKNRGGHGVVCHKITEKTGKLAVVITVADDDDIMLITNEGTIIRTPVSSINLYSRTATGVIVMRLAEGAYINNATRLERDEEIDKQTEDSDREIEESSDAEKETPKTEEREALASEEESF